MPKVTKNKSVLSVAFQDIPFLFFLFVLASKSLFFIYFLYDKKLTFFAFIITFPPTFGVIFFLLSISLFINRHSFKLFYLCCINIILSLLFMSQTLYFAYFSDFASIYNLRQISMLCSILTIVMQMIHKEFFFVADLFFIPFIYYWFNKKYDTHNALSWFKGLGIFFLICLVLNTFPIAFNLFHRNLFRSHLERRYFVRAVGIINYQLFDIYNYIRTQFDSVAISESDMSRLEDWFQQIRPSRTIKNHLTNSIKMNLLAIQVESLQNFVIGMRWEGNEVTPNLNRLVASGIYFNNIYDQTWAGNTSDATFLANCSLYPSKRGAVSFTYAQNDYYCLPQILREHGYETASLHAYRGAFWNRAIFEKRLGFHLQFYEDKYVIEDRLGWGLSDKSFFRQSKEILKGIPSPFYVLLTTLTSHVPFDGVTTEIDSFHLGRLEGSLIGNYLRSIHYVDSAIGDFLQSLNTDNLLSNTIVVIYGDHNARLKEDDLNIVGINNMTELKKIPLILKLPTQKYASCVDCIGGLIDFAPTISNILGINISNTYFLGTDLMSENNGRVIFRDGSYMTGDDKFNKDHAIKQLSISDLIIEHNYLSRLRMRKNEDDN